LDRIPEKDSPLATDYAQLTKNLLRFYDFTNKIVLFVGAGGRQLLDPSAGTKKLIAIDQDVEALREIAAKVAEKRMEESVEVVGSKFEDVARSGDVVYFEFCLHEMADPEKALRHAKNLARDLVVFDHSPGSEWIFYGAEEDKVCHSAQAMERFGLRRHKKFHTEQRFQNYAELLAKVSPQGPTAIQRAQRFAGATNIVIPMRYELNLL
jgi:SAM-dependent methyltransferase